MVYSINKQSLLEEALVLIEETKKVGTVYEKGTALGKMNRPELAKDIKDVKQVRDHNRKLNNNIAANYIDNASRIMSQENKKIKDMGYVNSSTIEKTAGAQQPRLYQSARK
jgi:hypothetical protein